MSNNTLGCTEKQGAEHGGEARRGRHAQAADESPRRVGRGQKLQGVGIVDWLAGTFVRPDMTAAALIEVAHWCLAWLPEGASQLDRGMMGYTHGWCLAGGGLLLYNPARADMGVHFSLSSSCLALLDETPKQVIERVMGAGGHFTRVDVAVDTDQVTVDQVRESIRRNEVVTRSSEIDLNDKLRRKSGEWVYGGAIIRVGSRSSKRYVRIYDKAKQMKEDGIWTRCEVEFKKDAAQIAAEHIRDGVDVRSLILSAIDFRDRECNENVTRCERLPWWEAWIGQAKRVSFAVRKTLVESVERAYDWVQKQVAPTLAFLDAFFRKEPSWVYRLCDANEYRIRPELRALLAVEGGV